MATTRTKHEEALLKGLQHAVHGVRSPFTCGGTLVPEQPVTLCFPDNTKIPVLRAKDPSEQERLLRPLVERCTAAAFGVGRQTRYDRTIRDALQIKAEGGSLSVLHFDPAAAGILEQIRTATWFYTLRFLRSFEAGLFRRSSFATNGPRRTSERFD